MKYLISLYVWFVAGFVYSLTFLIIIILNPFVSKRCLFKIQQIGGKTALFLSFFRVKVNKEEEIDLSQNYIFMANHVSLVDVLVMAAYLPKYSNAIEADSHFKWFFYGKIIKIFEQIPINRKNPRSSLKSFEIAKERLKKGRSIIVFPEGTRSMTDKMNPFKTLPFNFAIEAQTAIVPVGLQGFAKINAETFWIRPAKLYVNYGKIIPAESVKNSSIEELKEQVYNEIVRQKNLTRQKTEKA